MKRRALVTRSKNKFRRKKNKLEKNETVNDEGEFFFNGISLEVGIAFF